ncbi:primosomal protein N', partial [Lysobacter sp. 1R34A]
MPEALFPPPATVWRVALPLPLPRLFDYLPPAGQADGEAGTAVGHRVRVPFGRRELVGVVAETGAPEYEADPAALKTALGRIDADPLLHGELFDSLRWLARYTHAPLGEVLATALPGPLRHGEALPDTHAWAWRLTEAGRTAREGLRNGRPRRLADLLQDGPQDEDRLEEALDDWRSAARALAKRALAERIAVPASA